MMSVEESSLLGERAECGFFSKEIGFLKSSSLRPPCIKDKFLEPKELKRSTSGCLLVEFQPF